MLTLLLNLLTISLHHHCLVTEQHSALKLSRFGSLMHELTSSPIFIPTSPSLVTFQKVFLCLFLFFYDFKEGYVYDDTSQNQSECYFSNFYSFVCRESEWWFCFTFVLPWVFCCKNHHITSNLTDI